MAIFRVHKENNYTTIDNNIFKNKELSWKAKGILTTMLSLPNDWEFSVEGLAIMSDDKTSATRTGIQELEQKGYLKRTRVHDSKGIVRNMIYDIYEKPICDFPTLENPTLENQPQLNTNNINNLNNKKKEIYKESWDCDEYVKTITDSEISYLNELTGRNYRSNNPKTISLIRARLKDGFKAIDIMRVIETKCEEWLDTDMEKYLRPETLFGSKFENYLNQRRRK